VENSGIIFLDELDKIAGREGGRGPTCPGRGAAGSPADRRGSTVTTKYGMVRTDHILFIAAGAFTWPSPRT